MIVPGYPDGVDPIDVLKDLRRVKTSDKVRGLTLHLMEEYKERNLNLAEAKWVRTTARRYLKKINELHGSMEMARTGDAKQRLGYRVFEKAKQEASANTKKHLLMKLRSAKAKLESAEEDGKDFGI